MSWLYVAAHDLGTVPSLLNKTVSVFPTAVTVTPGLTHTVIVVVLETPLSTSLVALWICSTARCTSCSCDVVLIVSIAYINTGTPTMTAVERPIAMSIIFSRDRDTMTFYQTMVPINYSNAPSGL